MRPICHRDSVVAISLDITLTAWAAFCDGGAGGIGRVAKSLFAPRFVLAFHSAKIAAMTDFQ
jgi:hypothetical protein